MCLISEHTYTFTQRFIHIYILFHSHLFSIFFSPSQVHNISNPSFHIPSLCLSLSLSLSPSIFSGVSMLYLSHILFVEHLPILSPFCTLSYIPFLCMHPLPLTLSHSTNIFSQSHTHSHTLNTLSYVLFYTSNSHIQSFTVLYFSHIHRCYIPWLIFLLLHKCFVK